MENKIKHLSLYNDVGQAVNMSIKTENNLYPHLHDHTFWEFMLIEDGSFAQYINDEKYILNKNELHILPPSTAHLVQPLPNKQTLFVNFEVSSSFMQDCFLLLGLDLDQTFSFDFLKINCSDFEMNSFASILTNLPNADISSNDSKQPILKLIVLKLISKTIQHLNTAPTFFHKNDLITKVLTELNDKNNFSLTINQICAKLNYCHEYITRLFKQNGLNLPVNIFLKNKLSHSCTYLISSSLTITHIAELCGINSTSYFNKSFKKEYGLTPSEYRKKYAIPLPIYKN